ncbi:uncharacterized protein LOC135833145 [Planococcus citri]|uniref:uncharacterized protein LOC135833145 n=1 Tax=Planococcus citri TaxID=170843 RepID=UPI0031F78AD6
MFVQFFTLLLALCHQTILAHPTDVRSEKPLFVPTFNYPTLVHFNPLSYGGLESASLYPQYAPAYGHEYWDSLQRQFPYQDTEKRLEGFLYAGKTKKQPPVHDHNEDEYKQKLNKLSLDEIKPDLDDLDLKFKRSLTYTSWSPPTLSSTNNLDDRVQPSASRSVPFGPYTTWLPLEGPLVGYGSGSPQTINAKSTKGASLKKTNRRRRRREVIYADKGDHLTIPPQPLFIHQDYIPVPIAYSTPIIRNVPNTEDNAAVVNDVYPAVAHVAAVSPSHNFYTGKIAAALKVIAPSTDQDISHISYNLVRKK